MPVEIITKDDLREFKEELLQDIKSLLLALDKRTAHTQEADILDSLPDRLRSRDIRKLFAISSVTVWQWEKKSILNPNVISGRKYYKKADILKLLREKAKCEAMFDGVRLHICSDSTARWLVYESKFRDQFHTETYTSTGEIKSVNKNGRHTGIKYILDLPHLSLTITVVALRHIMIVGSLHKFYHGDNYSDFHHSEVAEAIHILSQLLRTNPADIAIHNLEIGVNASPLFNPYEFCDNLIAYKDKPFYPFKKGNNKSEIGFEASKLQYNIKVYDKGKQYLLSENILRYEYKAKVMYALRHSGIHTLADLLDRDKVACLKNILLASFDCLIINDPIAEKSNLSRHEYDIYTECLNPKMWKQYNPDKYYKRKRQFNEITDEFGAYKWRSTTRRLISHKFDLLLYHSPIAATDVLIRGINTLTPIF